jgi:hypothetical protein
MHRRIWLLVAVFAVLALTLGTSGFSAASIDRGIAVNVADDEDAYVGLADPGAHGNHPDWMPPEYSAETPVTENDSTARLFVVRNALGEGQLRVTARNADDDGVTLVDAETAWVEASTGPEAVSGTVDCPEGVHGPVRLELTVVADAADSAFRAEIDYPVTVVCATAEPTPTTTPESDADEGSERTEADDHTETPDSDD